VESRVHSNDSLTPSTAHGFLKAYGLPQSDTPSADRAYASVRFSPHKHQGGLNTVNTIFNAKHKKTTCEHDWKIPRSRRDSRVRLGCTSVGTLEFRCIMEPVRSYSQNIEYYQAWCDSIDLDAKTIVCTSSLEDKKDKFTVPYDKLVISVGAYSNTFGIPGVKEYALFLKDIGDARKIRSRVLECFEHASQPGITVQEQLNLLHFAVVGGGPTGIEFSAELYDFLSEDLSRLYPALMDKVQMSVYDVAPQILGNFDKNLGAYAAKRFRRKGIQIKTGKHVQEITKHSLKIQEDGEVPYGMLVWATGLMQNPLVRSLDGLAKDLGSQRIITDGRLRVLNKDSMEPFEDVFALGDCATIQNCDLPATAQVANQKAHYLGRGAMAYIGNWEAVVDMSPVHRKAKEQGHLAWFFWRSSYLSMSASDLDGGARHHAVLVPLVIKAWLV
ncbi:FAD/NAD(P)-binding domain-containing protein, partial [Jimgerdemannia flammicorona]